MSQRGLVVIRGGGDLGTGVAHRLVRSRYRVVILESERPTAVRRAAAFAEAVYSGSSIVEDVTAERVDRADVEEYLSRHSGREGAGVPVVVDPDGALIEALEPEAIVDARMAKTNLGTGRDQAPLVIGLGPGFRAGGDVDAVIETKRGHLLGRVIYEGETIPNTGVPGEVGGASEERLLRAPVAGEFKSTREIGDLVSEGQEVGRIAGVAVEASVDGVIRGLVADGVALPVGGKVGDVDPRGREIDPKAISDKARAVGGAVLEALLSRGVLPRDSG